MMATTEQFGPSTSIVSLQKLVACARDVLDYTRRSGITGERELMDCWRRKGTKPRAELGE
jgi:hypothetical protein